MWSTLLPALSLLGAFGWGKYVGRAAAPIKPPPLVFNILINGDRIGGFEIADIEMTTVAALRDRFGDPDGNLPGFGENTPGRED